MPATARQRLTVLIVTDPASERSSDALAIAQALTDSGTLVLGVRAGDATLPDVVARLKPDVVVVNGISSGLAAACALGVPWTHRDHAQGVMLVTGHAREGAPAPDWPTLAQAEGIGSPAILIVGDGVRRPGVAKSRSATCAGLLG